ncbi:MAG: hypothetical protein L7U48_02365 [Candidatus Poseidoniaceae archaeon]|nr:hypothetical protein [Candidatus Poseidoniaceae archaeon]
MGGFWQFFGLPDPAEAQRSGALPSAPIVAPAPPEPEPTPPVRTGPSPHFIDLGDRRQPPRHVPHRAVRYLAPDASSRLPVNGMLMRVQDGDSLFVDLRSVAHMHAHQDALRSELRRLGETTGVGAWALDPDDRLFLIPGADVVMDTARHELGGTALLPMPSS